jgi:hypothetical protein
VLELHSQEQVDQKPAEAFRVVQPSGAVDLWTPPESNGQELPPHS